MARIEQITEKAQLAPEYHSLYDRIAQARGQVGGPYSILLHAPAVADKVDALAASLRADSLLTPQEFVLAALGVARARDCLFVWSVQAPAARRVGISEAAIAAVRDRTATGLSDDQADVVKFVGQVVGGPRVDQQVFDRLKERHGERWLVELTAVAGHFGLISGINNAFEVPPASSGDSLPV
ncbi:MAG TPA: carboxymuconolactone decarboxylase family protein [Chloroflexota bacterium]|nr:carboxymuconolactone decarboxylase family protein [Chloroflexota bacterium]